MVSELNDSCIVVIAYRRVAYLKQHLIDTADEYALLLKTSKDQGAGSSERAISGQSADLGVEQAEDPADISEWLERRESAAM